MLIIADEQLACLEEAKLCSRLLHIAQRRFPEVVRSLGPAAARERLAQAVRSARDLGLASNRSHIGYCLLSVLLGTNLSSFPAFQEFWQTAGLSADEKMRLFLSRLAEGAKAPERR
jgi:hypothetical protein